MNKLLRNSVKIICCHCCYFCLPVVITASRLLLRQRVKRRTSSRSGQFTGMRKMEQRSLGVLKKRLDEVCLFGVYFEEDGKLFLPEELTFDKRVAKKKNNWSSISRSSMTGYLPMAARNTKNGFLQDLLTTRKGERSISRRL